MQYKLYLLPRSQIAYRLSSVYLYHLFEIHVAVSFLFYNHLLCNIYDSQCVKYILHTAKHSAFTYDEIYV